MIYIEVQAYLLSPSAQRATHRKADKEIQLTDERVGGGAEIYCTYTKEYYASAQYWESTREN